MIKNFVKATVAGAVLFGGALLIMDYALSMPEVYKSYSSRECVKVENYPGMFFNRTSNYSCDNMPSKFDLTWVR